MNKMEFSLAIAASIIMKNGEKIIDNDLYTVFEDKEGNRFISGKDHGFHMLFRKSDGFTAKWGKTFAEDPAFNPFGNEIADIEITTRCSGIRDVNHSIFTSGIRRITADKHRTKQHCHH